MKKILITTLCVCFFAQALWAQSPLSDGDRKKALEHLEMTQSKLLESVKGLSEEQLNYKPAPEVWSIAEVVEHLAISETNIFALLQMSLENEPDPSMRSEVKMSDDQIIGFISTRDQKVKTRKEFEPTNQFGAYPGALKAFKDKRKASMKYIKKTDDDLRNRYADLPFGKIDAYQVILFMSGHTTRHIKQIEELKESSAFPS